VLQRAHEPLTTAQIAERLGVHKNTVRFHLESLAESALVQRTTLPTTGPGRPAQAFTAVASMDPTGPRHFRDLAAVLTQALGSHPDGAALAMEAGRQWGRRVAAGAEDPIGSVNEALEALVELLTEFGFAPEYEAGGDTARDGGASAGQGGSGAVEIQRGARTTLPLVSARRCPFLELAEEHQRIVCPVHLGLMRGALETWGSQVEVTALEPFIEPDRCQVQLSTREEQGDKTYGGSEPEPGGR